MERRSFLKNGLSRVLYALGAVILAYPVLSFMTFKKTRKRTIVFHPDEQTAAVFHKKGVYLIKGDPESYALSVRCTHLGCTLNYDPLSRIFQCPCLGSIFSLSGKRLAGPAKKDLERVPMILTTGGDIVVTVKL